MLHRDDIASLINEALCLRSEAYDSDLRSILDRYPPRKFVEVTSFLLPLSIRRIVIGEKWWLETIRLWHAHLSELEFDFQANIDFLVEKNKQYGSSQLYLLDTLGIWLRSIDKVHRIQTIDDGIRTNLLNSESRHDSITDLFNYALLAVLVMRRKVV